MAALGRPALRGIGTPVRQMANWLLCKEAFFAVEPPWTDSRRVTGVAVRKPTAGDEWHRVVALAYIYNQGLGWGSAPKQRLASELPRGDANHLLELTDEMGLVVESGLIADVGERAVGVAFKQFPGEAGALQYAVVFWRHPQVLLE